MGRAGDACGGPACGVASPSACRLQGCDQRTAAGRQRRQVAARQVLFLRCGNPAWRQGVTSDPSPLLEEPDAEPVREPAVWPADAMHRRSLPPPPGLGSLQAGEGSDRPPCAGEGTTPRAPPHSQGAWLGPCRQWSSRWSRTCASFAAIFETHPTSVYVCLRPCAMGRIHHIYAVMRQSAGFCPQLVEKCIAQRAETACQRTGWLLERDFSSRFYDMRRALDGSGVGWFAQPAGWKIPFHTAVFSAKRRAARSGWRHCAGLLRLRGIILAQACQVVGRVALDLSA